MAGDHYLVLARKWRPQRFEDVVGQEHVTRTLQNAIRAGRVGHAFLFIGSRGIGKTTSARILAKALNCLQSDKPTPDPCGECPNCRAIAEGNSIDVMEIDGASNNSVDDVRQIRENIRMAPANSRYKIYVIDEVHQLSISAFNALLKTLEEPPPHAVFILATTEAHKVPATIVSRCQRYDFRRVGLDTIVALLRGILESEGVKCSDEALAAIARAADGGVRDAESILDQLVSYCDGEITFQDVFDVLGLVDWQVLHDLCNAIHAKDVGKLLQIVEDVVISGKDLGQFVDEILRYFRNLLVCKSGAGRELLGLPENEAEEMAQHAARFTLTELIRLVEQFAELAQGYDTQLAQRTALEALLIRISKRTVEVSLDTLLEKLALIEANAGAPGQTPQPAPQPRAIQGASPSVAEALAPIAAPKPAPVQATEQNVADVWRDVVEAVRHDDMNLGICLAQSTPKGIEDTTLIVQYNGTDHGKKILARPENVAKVNDALAELTANLRACRIEFASNGARPAKKPRIEPSKFDALRTDPHVAAVLDTFKGEIVDVQPPEDST